MDAREAAHITVLKEEVVDWLRPGPEGRYLDATLGLGGHTEALLAAAPGAIVLGLDRDERALESARERLAPYGERAILAHAAFSRFTEALETTGWKQVNGVVMDLGVSSMQLDTPERGFSFLADGPLDMRMDPSSGLEPASTLVNRLSHGELARIIREYGEDPMAGRIAKHILAAREEAPIESTARLAKVVENAYPAKMRATARRHPATRTFQGLRMAVNRELEELEDFLERIVDHLACGARVAVISFHSLEDRRVKHAFRREAKACTCPTSQMHCTCRGHARLKVLTKKPHYPSEAEQAANPRSRSAKLRVAERLPDPEPQAKD